MSIPPPRSVPKSEARRLSWTLALVTGLLFCGLPLGFVRYSDRNESREAHEEIGRHLTLVEERDRAGAAAMLCGGDDTSAAELPGMNQPEWRLLLAESFTIVSTWDWSWVNGRGGPVVDRAGQGTGAGPSVCPAGDS